MAPSHNPPNFYGIQRTRVGFGTRHDRLVHDAVLSHGGSSCYVADKAMLPEVLAGQVRPGDLVITLGAGDISLIGSLLLPLLQDADA